MMRKQTVSVSVLLLAALGLGGCSTDLIGLGIGNPEDPSDPNLPDNGSRPSTIVSNYTGYGIDYGAGVNTLLGAEFVMDQANCVKVNKWGPAGDSAGGRVAFTVTNVTDTTDYFEKLQGRWDMKLGMTAVLKGVPEAEKLAKGELNASVESIREKKIVKTNAYALVIGRKVFETFNAQDITVSQDTIDIYTKRPERFFPDCGDEYVHSIKLGATVYGLIECETTSSNDRDYMEQIIKGEVTSFTFTGAASMKDMIDRIIVTSGKKCKMTVEIGGGVGKVDGTDTNTFVTSILDYLQNATPQSAIKLEIATKPYRTVQVAAFQDMFDKAMKMLNTQKSALKMMKSSFDFQSKKLDTLERLIQDYQALPDWADPQGWRKQRASLVKDVVDSAKRMYTCARDPLVPNACTGGESPW